MTTLIVLLVAIVTGFVALLCFLQFKIKFDVVRATKPDITLGEINTLIPTWMITTGMVCAIICALSTATLAGIMVYKLIYLIL